jgi:hypothetical protein
MMKRGAARPFLAARSTFIAAATSAILAACTLSPDPELQADEQRAQAARDKLALDEQSGDKAATATDVHALLLARQPLLHDRGQLTQEERRYEDPGAW